MAGTDYRQAASQIIEIVGRDNIMSATHCATRLRLIVKDKDKIDEKKLEKIPLVKGTFFNAGQYQIILGTGIVNKVYAEMESMGLKTLSRDRQETAEGRKADDADPGRYLYPDHPGDRCDRIVPGTQRLYLQ